MDVPSPAAAPEATGLTAESLRAALPRTGLFAEKEWLLSPEPFPLAPALVSELERLGHRLHQFLGACDRLYRRSAKGTAPAYVAGYLDAGKPGWLVEHARRSSLAGAVPRVIRPDLLLTATGKSPTFAISELDGVPGGIGLTAWLNRTYAAAGVIGGPDGMLDGFGSILPGGGDILVSAESAGYRPEMGWLAGQLGGSWAVESAETYQPRAGRDVYRFFELFDFHNIPPVRELARLAEGGELAVTPPLKPHLEEKLWAALFWLRPLDRLWRQELRTSHLERLRHAFPYSWVVDPAPLPNHAVLPRLRIQSWDELAHFSQKDREFALKISGFSETAWGSRGVAIGHDLSGADWEAALGRALDAFPHHPHVLQEFHQAALVRHPYWDPDTGDLRTLEGRARLCPYYFTSAGDGKTRLGGVLATIVPADKKVIHGMRDAILVPCMSA
ncbi:hypothetical protein BH23VER1_BH23VER1_23480 [soil metagenome]